MSEHDLAILACYAHPDDEQGVTGTLAKAVHYGHRVGILMTTRGEVGEIADPALATPETLGAVREREMLCAAEAIGIPPERVYFLDYRDSGMAGTPPNADPRAAMNAPGNEAVGRIVAVIRRVRPAVLLTFDATGGYGHPDHLAVHHWTTVAFAAAGDPAQFPDAGPAFQPARLFYAGFPRSWIRRFAEIMQQAGVTAEQVGMGDLDIEQMGMPDELITNLVDTHEYAEVKARSLACHATQQNPNSPFARIPPDLQRVMRAQEVYHLAAGTPFPPGADTGDLFAGLG